MMQENNKSIEDKISELDNKMKSDENEMYYHAYFESISLILIYIISIIVISIFLCSSVNKPNKFGYNCPNSYNFEEYYTNEVNNVRFETKPGFNEYFVKKIDSNTNLYCIMELDTCGYKIVDKIFKIQYKK